MQWFAGTVPLAIQISRKNRALLIVYISTDSPDGQLFDAFWNNVDSANLLCPVVGIKLKAGEVPAQQFAEIYPTPIVPAAYLIDLNGKPLEVITTLVGKEYDQFRAKFDQGVAQFLNQNGNLPEKVPETSQVQVPQEVATPQVQQPAIDSELAEKVKRAKELLEIKKQKELKAKKEAEKREKEELQKAQVAQKEREDKALLEAARLRKKEKADAEKEKERILEQIKQDRSNAIKRFVVPPQNAPKPEENSNSKNASGDSIGKAVPSDRCRLQVRLPDGSTFVEEFPSDDVLNSLVEIIRQKIGGNFEISQPYPRRVFSVEDYSKTYLDNKLTPSTALVVILKPSTSSAVIAQSTSLFSLILSPIWLIWNVFSNFIGWGSSKKEDGAPGASGASGASRSRGMPRSAEVRRRGNIAGLQNPNDDDPEERASFNGNSTQFM